MVLLGASCLALTQVSVDGSFLGDLFPGLLIFGLGMGAAFVAGSIASLAGVAEQHSGAAWGLQTTSFNIGTALWGRDPVDGRRRADQRRPRSRGPAGPSPFALTEGYRSALAAAVGFTVLGLIAALASLSRLQDDRAGIHEAVSVPAPDAARPIHQTTH
jgi:hypothetical protein